jgi:hypothetical protein
MAVPTLSMSASAITHQEGTPFVQLAKMVKA